VRDSPSASGLYKVWSVADGNLGYAPGRARRPRAVVLIRLRSLEREERDRQNSHQ
jgi:hypothetical protein